MNAALLKENPPKKIDYINSLAASGKSRQEISETLGYKDSKNLYVFMRRQGLEWDSKKNLYVIKGSREAETAALYTDIPSGKVGSVLSMLDKGFDGKEIAQRLGFGSYQEMADYMRGKGYAWDNKRQNYIKKTVESELAEETAVYEAVQHGESAQYSDILSLLRANKDKLKMMFEASDEGIPRYNLPGVNTLKTINITNTVNRLIKDFSAERKISQKEIIEIAVIGFLKQYGYAEQVKAILHI